MSAQRQLPQYQCHKKVWALKIKEVICHADPDPKVTVDEFAKTKEFAGGHLFFEDTNFACIPFDAAFFHKHNPKPGDYYVVYDDGYKSISPAKAFEAGYSRI